jgi:membrane protease subunit HflC
MKKNLITVVIAAVLVVIFALLLFTFKCASRRSPSSPPSASPWRPTLTMPARISKWPGRCRGLQVRPARSEFRGQVQREPHGGQHNLLTSVYVGWKISDAATFFPKFAGGSVPAAQRMLESMLRSAKSAVIGQHTLSEFVNVDPKDLQVDAIEQEIEQSVQAQLQTNNYGIQLEFLGFKKIGLPESVTQAVFERMKAERTVLISRAKFEGEAEAQKIKSAADRLASETVNNAVADATRIRRRRRGRGRQGAAVFQQNPELANFLLRIDALQQSLNQRSTLIFDERTPPFDLFTGIPASSSTK